MIKSVLLTLLALLVSSCMSVKISIPTVTESLERRGLLSKIDGDPMIVNWNIDYGWPASTVTMNKRKVLVLFDTGFPVSQLFTKEPLAYSENANVLNRTVAIFGRMGGHEIPGQLHILKKIQINNTTIDKLAVELADTYPEFILKITKKFNVDDFMIVGSAFLSDKWLTWNPIKKQIVITSEKPKLLDQHSPSNLLTEPPKIFGSMGLRYVLLINGYTYLIDTGSDLAFSRNITRESPLVVRDIPIGDLVLKIEKVRDENPEGFPFDYLIGFPLLKDHWFSVNLFEKQIYMYDET